MAKKRKKDENESARGRVIATNRRARHDYFVERSYEAGLVLKGTEVKSLRGGKASLIDAFAAPIGRDLWVQGIHIPHYEQGNRYNVENKRPRKLLLHRAEIDKLIGLASQTGYTLVPLRLYFDENNRAKVEIGVCRGKRDHDKRHAIKERDQKRDTDREMREFKR